MGAIEKPKPATPVAFRLHFANGAHLDVRAENPDAARKLAGDDREKRGPITRVKRRHDDD